MREASKRKIKLSEEIERRLTHYEQMIEDANMVDDARLGAILNTRDDDNIEKLAERIAVALEKRKAQAE